MSRRTIFFGGRHKKVAEMAIFAGEANFRDIKACDLDIATQSS
jgi:hypothetical protein